MFKNENGFSLVELAIAAGLAVALAATAVTILSGTTATLSSNANGAAGTSSQYNTDVLANSAAGSSTPAAATFGTAAAIISTANATLWDGAPDAPSATNHFLTVIDNGGYGYGSTIGGAAGLNFNSLAEIEALIASGTGNGPYAAFVYDLSGAAQGHIVASYMGGTQHIYNVDVNGNVIAF